MAQARASASRFMSPYQAAVWALIASRAGCLLKGRANVNSEERRAARRARREEERAAKREKRLRNVASLESLVKAAEQSANGIR